jgi:hypothetical protein
MVNYFFIALGTVVGNGLSIFLVKKLPPKFFKIGAVKIRPHYWFIALLILALFAFANVENTFLYGIFFGVIAHNIAQRGSQTIVKKA